MSFSRVWYVTCLVLAACSGRDAERRQGEPPVAASAGERLGTKRAALVSTVSVTVAGDTYLQSGSPNQNRGGDTRLSLQSSGKHRSLLFFSPSELSAAVGAGALISARIDLTLSSSGSNWGSSGRLIAIHRLAQSSAEYQATWNCALDANVNNQQADCSGAAAWNMSATDPALSPWQSPASATALIINGQTGVVSFDVTSDVSAILSGSSAGHGWLVKKVEENLNGSLEFASRELGSAPQLVLEVDGAPNGGGSTGPVVGSATLAANADTHVRQGQPNQNFGADGILRIQASGRNRALLGFDPAATTTALVGPLVRARLQLPIAETFDNWGPSRALGAHLLRRAWSEPGATWNCAVDANVANSVADCSGDAAWVMFGSADGAPWVDPPTDTVLVASGQTGTLELDVTRDLACYLAGHTPLHGWLIKKEVESQDGKIELASRETATDPSLLLEWTHSGGTGVTVTAQDCAVSGPPGGCTPTAVVDTTCNGVDDDCDGTADDDYSVEATSCGIGACAASGATSCVVGVVVDSCTPGTPAVSDASCNAVDDDCDGAIDEQYVPVATSCGVGACAASGTTSCVAGGVVDNCAPGAPASADASCNEVDDDCDGTADEEYVGVATSCGVGGCSATGNTSCVAGQVVNGCAPGTPAPSDALCDGGDEDCDGSNDEDFVPACTGASRQTCSNGGLLLVDCADGNACNGQESCLGAGQCQPGTPPTVNDGNPCTADSCEPATGVAHVNVAAGTSCLDADACNGAESCNGAGTCLPGDALIADDQNPCTLDGCDSALGVTHDPAAEGIPCPDAAFCNGEEACNGQGACVAGAPVAVDDGQPCTVDGCSEAAGVTHVPRPAGIACEDGNVCNGMETCTSSGGCVAGTPLDTGSSTNPCVIETTCHPVAGLEPVYEPLGAECGAGFICDGLGNCLRDQGNGAPAVPLPPGAGSGISAYAPALPRDPLEGCALEPLDPNHVAVIAGSVTTWDDTVQERVPVVDAIVSVPTRCEFGAARTLSDGTFRFPINGGDRLMVRVEADADGDGDFDYLPVERAVQTAWRASAGIDDVELMLPAPVAATLSLVAGALTDDIVVNGPLSEDDRDGDGIAAPRTPSVLFKAGTVLNAVDENGMEVELEEAAIRMTEYTVGAGGKLRMPAPMPPGTAYGYAFELSVDGAAHVLFDRPAAFYVDNFIGAEAERSGIVSPPHRVGQPVPSWYYDREQGSWLREGDGLIIALVGVDANTPPRARIDADGDGDADGADDTYLAARNVIIDFAERELLAEEVSQGRRAEGSELWRVEMRHFSPFDFNWVLACEECMAGELLKTASMGGPAGEMMCMAGSAISVEAMTLGESFPVAGTPFSLNYSSGAVFGYKPRRQQRVDRSHPPLPPPITVKGLKEVMYIAGKQMRLEGCEPPPDQLCHPFDGFSQTPGGILWDGRDADGRIAYGTHRGGWGITTIIEAHTSAGFFHRELKKSLPIQLTVYDAKLLGFGGWTLSPHHFFDSEAALLFRGDGGEHKSRMEMVEVMHALPVFPVPPRTGGMRMLSDGSIFFTDEVGVYRIDKDGDLEQWTPGPLRVMAPASPDRMFFAFGDVIEGTPTLKRMDRTASGIQETASINVGARLTGLTVGPDNLVYALRRNNPMQVHRYTQDLQHADGGAAYFTLPNAPTTPSNWSAMSFYEDTLYIASGRLGGIFRFAPGDTAPVRIGNNGSASNPLVAGQPALSFPATAGVRFTSVRGTPFGVLFAVQEDRRLWLIDDQGILRHAAGNPAAAAGSGDGGPPLLMGLGADYGVDVAPDDSLVFYTRFPNPTIRRARLPGPTDFSAAVSVPSEDGRLSHEFDIDGHHLRTRNVHTNDIVLSFEYEAGLLSAIVEGDNLGAAGPSLPRTRILRNVGGLVTIEAPSGQRTTIAVDPSTGYASSIIDAAGATVRLSHDADGLLREMTDQRGFVHAYGYDGNGRLVADTSPGLIPQTLSGTQLINVTHENGEGEQSHYEVDLDRDTGLLTRTQQAADGSSLVLTLDKSLKRNQVHSDGTIVDETFIKHPTFTTAAPLLGARTTRLPSGRTRSETHNLSFAAGVWTETFGLNGNIATTRTNQALNTVTTTTALGRTVSTSLDLQGRPTRVQVGNLEPTLLTYDTQGRPQLITSGSGAAARTTQLDYYPDGTGSPEAGHLMSLTDASNQTVDFIRDAFGRALSATTAGHTTQLGFGPAGDLESVTTPNDDAHFQFYNGVHLLTEYVAPSAPGTDELTEYRYDNARRLTTTALPGEVTLIHARDALDPDHPERKGRLRSISSADNGNGTSPLQISYSYGDEVICSDPNDPETCPSAGPPGQLETLTRGDVMTTITWDGAVPVKETHIVEAGSLTGLADTEYAVSLNNDFNTSSDRVTVGSTTLTGTYSYDTDAILTCAGSGSGCSTANGVIYSFDNRPGDPQAGGHGLLEATTSGSVAEAFTYNTFGELATHVVSVGSTPVIASTYHSASAPRDALGRITTLTRSRGATTDVTTYGYDSKGQLVTVAPDGEPVRTNVYDPNGNRLCTYQAPDAGCTEPAIVDAQDRLLSYDGVEYLYTDRGSLFQRDDGQSLETFTYDALGNLTRFERDGEPAIDYVIDAQGRRVGKQIDGVLEKQYVWSGALRIAAELDAAGTVTSRFVYGRKVNVPDLIAKPGPGGTRLYRVITDHLGSPIYVVNMADANDVLLDATYDEWGKVTAFTSSTGSWPIPFGFAGGFYDEDTGLVRFGARDYDPRIGRWTSKDPIRWEGGQPNLYVYVGSDPGNRIDPFGLSSLSEFFDGAASFGNDLGIGLVQLAAQNGLLGSELNSHSNQLDAIIGVGVAAGLYAAPADAVEQVRNALVENLPFVLGRATFGVLSGTAIGRLGDSKIGLGLGAIAMYGGVVRAAMSGNERINVYEGMMGISVGQVCSGSGQ